MDNIRIKISMYHDYLFNFLSIESFSNYYKFLSVSNAQKFIDKMYFLDNTYNGNWTYLLNTRENTV